MYLESKSDDVNSEIRVRISRASYNIDVFDEFLCDFLKNVLNFDEIFRTFFLVVHIVSLYKAKDSKR
jgi:hypothetical protein